jgi:hypothetical protein
MKPQPNPGIIHAFTWRDSGKPRKTSVIVPVKIRTERLLKHYRYNNVLDIRMRKTKFPVMNTCLGPPERMLITEASHSVALLVLISCTAEAY